MQQCVNSGIAGRTIQAVLNKDEKLLSKIVFSCFDEIALTLPHFSFTHIDVIQNEYEMGKRAFHILLDQIKKKKEIFGEKGNNREVYNKIMGLV